MPRRKTKVTKKTQSLRKTHSIKKVQSRSYFHKLQHIKWFESYTSLLLGVVVVVVAVLFTVTILKQTKRIQETSSIKITPTVTQVEVTDHMGNKIYTVQSGDDLWHIAEKYYKSGYNWTDIASANKLENPGLLFAGTKLTIPNVTPKEMTLTPEQPSNAITGKSYTVETGDSLWDIAVRAYADGYKWTDIAKVNQLANPSLIYKGNVLIIPR
ncbi:MAG: LysM peptidoglycan-binding domain-containing protein [Candidatus Levyibacteriota bacterium]